MRAYKQTITKTEFVRELKAHQKADDFIKGRYWKDGKGCAVGCSLESISRVKGLKFSFDDHSLYPVHLGIPEWLARLEDAIFEGVSIERSKSWPVEFAEAIRVGADLEKAKTPFLIMVLEHSLTSMDAVKFDTEKFPEVAKAIAGSKAAVMEMIRCHRDGIDLAAAESAAWSAARSASRSSESAPKLSEAWSAAWSACYAASAAAATSTLYQAAEAAWYAARASSAASARASAYGYYADSLLEILRECK